MLVFIAGVRAFNDLKKMIDEMEGDATTLASGFYNKTTFENLRSCIESAETYYQNTFQFNLEKSSNIRSHSTDWLVSDPKQKNFQNEIQSNTESSELCDFCLLTPKICMALMGICSKIELHPKANKMRIDQWRYQINKSERAILEYRNYIIRNKVSNLDWENYLTTDEPETAVVTFDYAMNFLPQKCR